MKELNILKSIGGLSLPREMTGIEAVQCYSSIERLVDTIPREIEVLRGKLFACEHDAFVSSLALLRELLVQCRTDYLLADCDFLIKHCQLKKFAICEAVLEKMISALMEFSIRFQTAQYEDSTPSRNMQKFSVLLTHLSGFLKDFDEGNSLDALEQAKRIGFGDDLAEIREHVEKFDFITADKILSQIRQASFPQDRDTTTTIRKPMVLAIDDSPTILTSLKAILSEKYQFFAVTSGHAALKFLETKMPSIFIIDIEMPEMSGYELAAIIKEMGRIHTVVFLTGNATRDYVMKALQVGVTHFLAKPCSSESLLAKLAQIAN